MKILVDMNLSPQWCPILHQAGLDCVHWSEVGVPNAPDTVVLEWSVAHDHVLFTHDLDFGAILAASGAKAPSVLQLRTEDILPSTQAKIVIAALQVYQQELSAGALISLDAARSRVRLLPLP